MGFSLPIATLEVAGEESASTAFHKSTRSSTGSSAPVKYTHHNIMAGRFSLFFCCLCLSPSFPFHLFGKKGKGTPMGGREGETKRPLMTMKEGALTHTHRERGVGGVGRRRKKLSPLPARCPISVLFARWWWWWWPLTSSSCPHTHESLLALLPSLAPLSSSFFFSLSLSLLLSAPSFARISSGEVGCGGQQHRQGRRRRRSRQRRRPRRRRRRRRRGRRRRRR